MHLQIERRPKVVLIAGTRPEVIKLAPLHRALSHSTTLESVFISTGQHRQMLDQAFAAFGIRPDEDLNLMLPGQDLPGLTARVIESVSQSLARIRPSAVLVQGDTTTALGSALAAFYARIPIGHVEAGLRTYNLAEPWPEEMNRRLIAPISHWCFAPTPWSKSNLLSEGIDPTRIHVTGNTVVDALQWMRRKVGGTLRGPEHISKCGIPAYFSDRYLLGSPGNRPLILVTGHRRESFGMGIDNLCTALLEISRSHPEAGILFPVHLNPKVQRPVMERLSGCPRIALVNPVGYEEMLWLLEACRFVISDSGGIQEEAPSFGKPVLVTRDTTERPEGVEAGTCRLVGTNVQTIIREARLLLEDEADYQRRSAIANPYGDGHAAERIGGIIEEGLREKRAAA